MGHYKVVLESSEALEFSDSIKLFQVDARLYIPASSYVDSISSDDYTIKISDVEIIIKDDDCIEIDSAISNPINIKPVCLIDARMLVLSPYNFNVKLNNKTINYSVGLD
jgi:hypothetical protein